MDFCIEETVMQVDWAREERQSFLAKLGRTKHPVRPAVAEVWRIDRTARDSRSVQFQLRGGFSARAAWWNAFSSLHKLFSPAGTLESVMMRFHRFHHTVTLAILTYLAESRAFRDAILNDGFARAAGSHLARVAADVKRDKAR